ncbi:MAG: HEPN domain-containing protein [Proteobacteria bacterium]|nr:HEPN domain-containing protein [Pseudomonadota bacterium]
MKFSLEHLPKNKQTELRKLTSEILKSCKDVEKIILFGSYARGDFKEEKDLAPNRKSGHVSDYDILVVTEKLETLSEFNSNWNDADKLNLSAAVRILAINIDQLNEHLAFGQYLYSDIEKQGVMLYDSKKHKLAIKKKVLKNFEAQRIAQEHYDHWFDRANDFVDSYKMLVQKGKTASASFHLNQIVESCYKAILLVFTNYNPHEHHLKTLGKLVEKYHQDLANLFPQKTPRDRERFALMEYAYIGGRYDPKHKMCREDLEILAADVVKLLKITEEICKKKIFSYRP